ncbi:spore coat protein YsxE [Bacillus sp. BGMRC 2118]|nr:spore coat protein YsxE [Bacillus sp. BGMRC 2118]
MTTKVTHKYQRLLNEYGIEAEYIEDLGNIKKVHSNHGVVALKKSKLPYTHMNTFSDSIKFLHYKAYGFGVPIFRTKTGSHYVLDEDHSAYYLMPWLEDYVEEERNDHAFSLFKQLGELHARTAKDEKITSENVTYFTEQLKEKWKTRNDELARYVESCEDKIYMSPFELYFCTFYQDMIRACEFSLRKLDEWQELMEEKKTYRIVFTHGKPSFKHFLYNVEGHGMFINFERSSYLPPIYDLLYFFYRSCNTYPMSTDDRFQWFQTYRSHFPLKEEELTLFITQLSYPEKLYNVVTQYRTNPKSKTEIKHVQALQRAYWQMKNIEYFLTSVVMYEEQKKQQEEAQQE